ncbi:uncharacterized protein LOC135935857 [Cloeon dipterum]|uniref:uncharacterized protein LOC135935857 n=1 Tax=Cloeon dipterum TaxID=197152 RepID=UPI0032207200
MCSWVYYNRAKSVWLSGVPFIGGMTVSGLPIWVARTWHEDYLLPGCAVDGTGYFAFEGQVIKKNDFYVFFADNANYDFLINRNLLPTDNCVVAGQTPRNERLYVGKILEPNCQAIGWMHNGVCSAVLPGEVVHCSAQYSLLQKTYW